MNAAATGDKISDVTIGRSKTTWKRENNTCMERRGTKRKGLETYREEEKNKADAIPHDEGKVKG